MEDRGNDVRRRRMGPTETLATVVLALFGLALLGLGIPRTMAAWAALDARPALGKIRDGVQPSAEELREGVQGLQRAKGWLAAERHLTDLGTLEFLLAQMVPLDQAARNTQLATSERHLMEGLVKNPADGVAWYRLAQVRQAQGAVSASVKAALLQSVDMAPNQRQLWLGRAFGLIYYRSSLTPEEWEAAGGQLRTIWRTNSSIRSQLVELLRGSGLGFAVLKEALASDPEGQEYFRSLGAK
jgi:hypothetical protein